MSGREHTGSTHHNTQDRRDVMIGQYPQTSIEFEVQAITDYVEDELEKLRQMVRDDAPPVDMLRQIDKVQDEARNMEITIS